MDLINYVLFLLNLFGFFVPGILLSSFIPGDLIKDEPTRFYYVSILSFCSSSIIFNILPKTNILLPNLYKILFLSFIVFRYRAVFSYFKSMRNATMMVVALSSVLPIFYYVYNDGSFVRGWDAAKHLISIINTIQMNKDSFYSNTLSINFYPTGYCYAASFFALGSGLDVTNSFKVFVMITFFVMSLACYSFSRSFFSNKASVCSVISFSLVGYMFLQRGHYPFMLSLSCLAALFQLNRALLKGGLSRTSLFVYAFIMYSVYSFHPSPLVYFCIIVGSFYLSSAFNHGFAYFLEKAKTYFSVLAIIAVLIAVDLTLFFNQVDFLGTYFSGYYQSYVDVFYRLYIKEYFLLVIPFTLLFPFLVGLFSLRGGIDYSSEVIVTLFVSLIFCFVKVFPPYNARDFYFMFYPVHALSGYGIVLVSTEFVRSLDIRMKMPFATIVSICKPLIPLLLLSNSFINYYHFGVRGMLSQPEYITEEDFVIAAGIKDLNISGVVTSLDKPSSMLYQVYSTNIVFASPLAEATKTGQDLYKLYNVSTGTDTFNNILKEYNVTAIIIDSQSLTLEDQSLIIEKISQPYTVTQIERIKVIEIYMEN